MLERCWSRNDPGGLRPEWAAKIRRQLSALDAASRPAELDQPGWGFHALRADMASRYALTVSRNRRPTFAWDGEEAVDLDLEDYHGG